MMTLKTVGVLIFIIIIIIGEITCSDPRPQTNELEPEDDYSMQTNNLNGLVSTFND